MPEAIPVVDYLELGDPPTLWANACDQCPARYFDRRSACAACGGVGFHQVPVARRGVLRTFTIVHVAAPGVAVPFVAGVVDCDGISVRGNIINVPPDPEHVVLGMPLRLTTHLLGPDGNGAVAVSFGFEPDPAEGQLA